MPTMNTVSTARLAAVVAVAGLALAGCATGSSPEEEPSSPEPTMSATHDAMEDSMEDDSMDKESSDEAMEDDSMEDDAMDKADGEVPEQLQFTTTTLAGDAFEGASLVGQDAILWIWASWCPICQAEAPVIAETMDDLPEGVTIYGLAGNSDVGSSQGFVEEYGLEGMEHLFSEDGSLWSNFGISYQPALVMINDDGTIETKPGATGEAGIIQAAEWLAEN